MTQIESARQKRITNEIRHVAETENVDAAVIRDFVAAGKIVIPKNIRRNFLPRGIGKGLATKVNANIGTSLSLCDANEELKKLDAAVKAGADAVMDLSTGKDSDAVLLQILQHSPVMVGTVPIYNAITRLFEKNMECGDMTADGLFSEIETQGQAGVDFITVHCGITSHCLQVLDKSERLLGMVSRGGSLMAEWMAKNQEENPLYKYYDRLLEIARAYDMTLSLGDGLRPGTIFDAEDRAQISELILLGDLARRAVKAGIQVMIEGPGHVPLSMIADDIKQQKRLCNEAPYYVLGPLPTDAAAGHDHIAGAIGGAIAAAAGADFLCYLTPAEHLALPGVEDVREGVIASKIAAHIGDLEKNVLAAGIRDRRMSEARRDFDWETMFEQAIDPEKSRSIRSRSADSKRDVCSMCGDLCALKTYQRAKDENGRRAEQQKDGKSQG